MELHVHHGEEYGAHGIYVRSNKPRPPTSKNHSCICCSTTSTPLWRDIGMSRVLCNACGIRYKKYGVICPQCKVSELLVIAVYPTHDPAQYVPCKQEREIRVCCRCHSSLPAPSKRARIALDD